MGGGAIRRLTIESRESFVEAPRGRRERPVRPWVREAEEGRLAAHEARLAKKREPVFPMKRALRF